MKATLTLSHAGTDIQVPMSLAGDLRDWEEIEQAMRAMLNAAIEHGVLPHRPEAFNATLPKLPSIKS